MCWNIALLESYSCWHFFRHSLGDFLWGRRQEDFHAWIHALDCFCRHIFLCPFFHLKSLSGIIYCLSGIVGKHQRDALWSVYKYVPLMPCEASINMSHFHLSTAALLDCGIVESRSLTLLKCTRSLFRILFNGIFKVTLWCCWVSAASSLQTENNLTEVWNKSGHQGYYWNRAEVPLRQLRNFEVIFVGIRLRDVSGGAALDDLEYIDCTPSKRCTQWMDFMSSFGCGPMIGSTQADLEGGSDLIPCKF